MVLEVLNTMFLHIWLIELKSRARQIIIVNEFCRCSECRYKVGWLYLLVDKSTGTDM